MIFRVLDKSYFGLSRYLTLEAPGRETAREREREREIRHICAKNIQTYK